MVVADLLIACFVLITRLRGCRYLTDLVRGGTVTLMIACQRLMSKIACALPVLPGYLSLCGRARFTYLVSLFACLH
jgi:hypothetical protein